VDEPMQPLSSEEQQLLLRLQQRPLLTRAFQIWMELLANGASPVVIAGGMTDASKRRLTEVSAPDMAFNSGYAAVAVLPEGVRLSAGGAPTMCPDGASLIGNDQERP